MRGVLLACAGLVLLSCGGGALAATLNWGGSVGITSDYLVRGLSRSDHEASAQGEVHVAATTGWMAGAFVSTTRLVPGERRDAEVGAFVGRAWNWNSDWSSKIQLSHYSYPLNEAGSAYDYNEVSADLSFRDWLSLAVVYSPDAPRYDPAYGLRGYSATSGEINLQSPSWHRLSLNGGAGYSRYSGPNGGGFGYWSVGLAYDWTPVTISAGFVDTGAAAQQLFYDNAAQRRWLAAVFWRF